MLDPDQRAADRQSLTDEDLMLRVQAGEKACFDILVQRYKTRLFNYLLRLVRDPDLAEELAQDAFVRAYVNADKYRTIARFSTWLYTIATNLVRNRYRQKKRRPPVLSLFFRTGDGDRFPGTAAEVAMQLRTRSQSHVARDARRCHGPNTPGRERGVVGDDQPIGETVRAGAKPEDRERVHRERTAARVARFRELLDELERAPKELLAELLPDAYQINSREPLRPTDSPVFLERERKKRLEALANVSNTLAAKPV